MESNLSKTQINRDNFLPKWKLKPCCGFFLQGGVKAISIVDFGIHFFMIVIVSTGIAVGQEIWNADSPDRHFARPFYWAFYYFYHVCSMILAVLLFKVANQRNERRCREYWRIYVVFSICWLCVIISHSIWLHGLHPMVIALFGVIGVYKVYSVCVIKCFIKEITLYGNFNSALANLSDAEIEEFEKGNPPGAIYKSTLPAHGENFQNRPYNKDFEIEMDKLKIDADYQLGSGEFGTVWKAVLIQSEPKEPIVVAVKTASNRQDSIYFKALLSELKILSCIGHHENIVNLIGACTAQIRERKIYMVVEFCPYGNLFHYLKANRCLFVNQIVDEQIVPHCKQEGPYRKFVELANPVTTMDLIKWSNQTALGMEYISSRKVIHGDLAARNILLTKDRNVKISDFGLSRQLYHYTTYTKSEREPLPWQWLALESLCEMNFSTQSDVWSYGVTIWEFFSLASIPYPGSTWSSELIKQLKDGYRLSKPQYSTADIYDLMLRCWSSDPQFRPTFSEIVHFFTELLQSLKPEPDYEVKQENAEEKDSHYKFAYVNETE